MKRLIFFIAIFTFLFFICGLAYSDENRRQGDNATTSQEENSSNSQEQEEESSGPSFSAGLLSSEEEVEETQNIEVEGRNVKSVKFQGVTLRGNFTEIQNGVYVATGEIKPDWNFDIKIGAAGQITVDTNANSINGQAYIILPVYGKIVQVTDLYISKRKIKFKGVFTEAIDIPKTSVKLTLCQGIADFEISKKRIAVQAHGVVEFVFSGVPKVGQISIELIGGNAGFSTDIPPRGISISGKGHITIPVEPPIKVELEGSLTLTKNGIQGEGTATIFDVVEIGNGSFEINKNGVLTADGAIGLFFEDLINANLVRGEITVDLLAQKLEAKVTQDVSLLNGLITIPGSNNLRFSLNNREKTMELSGITSLPLTPPGTSGGEYLSFGIKNVFLCIKNYDSSNPTIDLNGDLFVSLWTIAGFSGKIENAVLSGEGSLYLPSGLKQLLDIEKLTVPISVDLHSIQNLAELNMEVSSLAIKHFPIKGPQLIVKNDGIHLKGEISILDVITLPLGDLVFTKNEKYTDFYADLKIGPFTVTDGHFRIPKDESEGIWFEGNLNIPGVQNNIEGRIYKDGTLKFSSLTQIGFMETTFNSNLSVSSNAITASDVNFCVSLGGISSCSLSFDTLSITPSEISGQAELSFSGVTGISATLSGNFSYDGSKATVTFPSLIELGGIEVRNVEFTITANKLVGSGEIVSTDGTTINASIGIENGFLVLKDPAGKVIVTGYSIASDFAKILGETAKEEYKVVSEDADEAMENLKKAAYPWARDAAEVAGEAKEFFFKVGTEVKDNLMQALDVVISGIKHGVVEAVAYVKSQANQLVDTFCNAVIALLDSVDEIFDEIDPLIPSGFRSRYASIKQEVENTAQQLRSNVENFREQTKLALYDLTGTISAIQQSAIDVVTDKANEVTENLKQELTPMIQEIDQLLTDIEGELKLAANASQQEAQKHINRAKTLASALSSKANSIIDNYKEKMNRIISPYVTALERELSPYLAMIEEKKNAAINTLFAEFKDKEEEFAPYIQPFKEKMEALSNFMEDVGGEALNKFNVALKNAGDAFNGAVQGLGAGFVKVSDLVGDAFVSATASLAQASQALHEGMEQAYQTAQDVAQEVAETAQNAAQTAQETAAEVYTQVAQTAENAYNQIYNTAQDVGNTVEETQEEISQQVNSAVNTVQSHLQEVASSVTSGGITDMASSITGGSQGDSYQQQAQDAIDTLSQYAQQAYNTAANAANEAYQTAQSAAQSAWNKVSGWFSSSSSSSQQAPEYDYTAPTISNVRVSSITTHSVTLEWDTNSEATTIVIYAESPDITPQGGGTNRKGYIKKDSSGNMIEEKHHKATITNLTPGKTYYFLVYSYKKLPNGNSTDAGYVGPLSATTLPDTALINGMVKDENGNPISGAKILVDGVEKSYSLSDGKFAVEVEKGVHNIKVIKESYLPVEYTTPNLSSAQILNLDFTLHLGLIRIKGEVKDALTKEKIVNAKVEVIKGPEKSWHVFTNSEGKFSMLLPMPQEGPLNCVLKVEKSKYCTYQSQQLTLPAGANIENLTIYLNHEIPHIKKVQVMDIEGGVTKKDIFYTTDIATSSFVQFGTSQEGYAYQTDMIENKSVFRVHLVGLTPAQDYVFRIVAKDSLGNNFVIYEGNFHTKSVEDVGDFTLYLYDPKTKGPIQGARVDIYQQGSSSISVSLPTDSEGKAFAHNLLKGAYKVTVSDYEGTFPAYLKKNYSFTINVEGGKSFIKKVYMPLDLNQVGNLFSITISEKKENSVKVNVHSDWTLRYHMTLRRRDTGEVLRDNWNLGIKTGDFQLTFDYLNPGTPYEVRIEGELLSNCVDGDVIKRLVRGKVFSTAYPNVNITYGLTPNPSTKDEEVTIYIRVFVPSIWKDSTGCLMVTLDGRGIWKRRIMLKSSESKRYSYTFKPSPGEHIVKIICEDAFGRAVVKEGKLIRFDFDRPQISIVQDSVPKSLKVGKKYKFEFVVSHVRYTEGLKYKVYWGDGKREEGPIKIKSECSGNRIRGEAKKDKISFCLFHVYEKDGGYYPEVKVIPISTGLESNTLRFYVWVEPTPPELDLSANVSGATAEFEIKVKKGGYPIERWVLNFGDGEKLEGKGDVEKIVSHLYKRKRWTSSYKKTFSAVLEAFVKVGPREMRYEKSVPIDIKFEVPSSTMAQLPQGNPKISLSSPSSLPSPSSSPSSDESVNLGIQVDRHVHLGDRVKVLVSLMPKSPLNTKAILTVEANDGWRERREVNLTERGNVILWWLPKEIGDYEISAQLRYKQGGKDIKLVKAVDVKVLRSSSQGERILKIEKIEVPKEVKQGEEARIKVIVKNYSQQEIKGEVILKVGRQQEYKKDALWRGREKKTIGFKWIPKEVKGPKEELTIILNYRIGSNERREEEKQTVIIKKEENIDVALENIKVPDEIYVGEKTKLKVILRNYSLIKQEVMVSLKLPSGREEKQRLNLRPKGRGEQIFWWTPEREGKGRIEAVVFCKDDRNLQNNRLFKDVKILPPKPRVRIMDIRIRMKKKRKEDEVAMVAVDVLVESLNIGKECRGEILLCLEGDAHLKREKKVTLREGRNDFPFDVEELKVGKYRITAQIILDKFKIKVEKKKVFTVK